MYCVLWFNFFLSKNIVLHKFFKFKPRRAKFLTIYQLYTNEICVREKIIDI